MAENNGNIQSSSPSWREQCICWDFHPSKRNLGHSHSVSCSPVMHHRYLIVPKRRLESSEINFVAQFWEGCDGRWLSAQHCCPYLPISEVNSPPLLPCWLQAFEADARADVRAGLASHVMEIQSCCHVSNGYLYLVEKCRNNSMENVSQE